MHGATWLYQARAMPCRSDLLLHHECASSPRQELTNGTRSSCSTSALPPMSLQEADASTPEVQLIAYADNVSIAGPLWKSMQAYLRMLKLQASGQVPDAGTPLQSQQM
jgi:hypothetical protein